MQQDVLTCPKEFNQNITGIFNSDFYPCSHSPPPRSLIIACRYLGYQSLTSAGHIRPAAQRHTFTVSLSPRCCLFNYLSPARSSFMLLFLRAPSTFRSQPGLHGVPSFISFIVIKHHQHQRQDSMGGVLLAAAAAAAAAKSPCRVWAPKSFWQDSLSHVIYHTKHLLYFIHQSLLIDVQLVTSAAGFLGFFLIQSGTFLNCRQPRWIPREWSATNCHL